HVDLLYPFGALGENGDAVVVDLHEAATDEVAMLAPSGPVDELARLHHREEGSVARQHAEAALRARSANLVHLQRDEAALRGHDVEVDGHRRTSASHLLGPLEDVLDGAAHEEGLLRNVVVLALEDLLEAPDRVLHLHVLAGNAGELLGHVEGLREEALDLARP